VIRSDWHRFVGGQAARWVKSQFTGHRRLRLVDVSSRLSFELESVDSVSMIWLPFGGRSRFDKVVVPVDTRCR
jgi:hypothetical protein